MLLVERWILARLRNQTFFSLDALNAQIRRLLVRLNDKPFQKLPGSRRSLFESLDRPAMRPLPAQPYVYAEWRYARVNVDYYVEVARHYYSVPHALVGKQLDVRLSTNTVEVFYQAKRIANHRRSNRAGHHTTVPAHMPKGHRPTRTVYPSPQLPIGTLDTKKRTRPTSTAAHRQRRSSTDRARQHPRRRVLP